MNAATRVAGRPATVRSIQFLRALAALAVVYYHSVDVGGVFGLPSTGAWGVDVFFVISGFIIGMVTTQNSAHFLRRRVFRVVPLYWLATLAWVTLVLAMPWRANSTEVTPLGLVQSLLFVPYRMTLRDGPILYLGWTLSYEMFFYLVVALMLWLLRDALRALVAAATLLGAIVLTGFLWPAQWLVVSYFQSPLILEFLAGVALFFLWRELRHFAVPVRWPGLRWGVLALAGIAAVAAFVALVRQDPNAVTQTGIDRVLVYGAPALLLVAAALVLEPLIRDGRATRWLVEIGDASYAMYLFHPMMVGFVSQMLLGAVIAEAGVPLRILLLLLTTAIVVLGSIAIDRWIDRPIQRGLRRAFAKREPALR